MFSSDRPIPRAAVVNKAREDISALKAQLAELVAEASHLQPTSSPAAAAAAASDTVAESQGAEALKQARFLLEGVVAPQQRASSVYGMHPHAAAEFNVEQALLEAENERLREAAQILLMRQKLLEELVASKGVKVKLRQHAKPVQGAKQQSRH
ncbi:hypothetical protein QJQ45_014262 [Haematococcus lacustris]|nr:hypothetical protein QJQ45_014262 [Haematococcus lacustris]